MVRHSPVDLFLTRQLGHRSEAADAWRNVAQLSLSLRRLDRHGKAAAAISIDLYGSLWVKASLRSRAGRPWDGPTAAKDRSRSAIDD